MTADAAANWSSYGSVPPEEDPPQGDAPMSRRTEPPAGWLEPPWEEAPFPDPTLKSNSTESSGLRAGDTPSVLVLCALAEALPDTYSDSDAPDSAESAAPSSWRARPPRNRAGAARSCFKSSADTAPLVELIVKGDGVELDAMGAKWGREG